MTYPKHYKVYCDYFGYDYGQTIICEHCGTVANNIHHITPRSKFGKKMKHEQDKINNLIALCNDCHRIVHTVNVSINEAFKEIVKKRHEK